MDNTNRILPPAFDANSTFTPLKPMIVDNFEFDNTMDRRLYDQLTACMYTEAIIQASRKELDRRIYLAQNSKPGYWSYVGKNLKKSLTQEVGASFRTMHHIGKKSMFEVQKKVQAWAVEKKEDASALIGEADYKITKDNINDYLKIRDRVIFYTDTDLRYAQELLEAKKMNVEPTWSDFKKVLKNRYSTAELAMMERFITKDAEKILEKQLASMNEEKTPWQQARLKMLLSGGIGAALYLGSTPLTHLFTKITEAISQNHGGVLIGAGMAAGFAATSKIIDEVKKSGITTAAKRFVNFIFSQKLWNARKRKLTQDLAILKGVNQELDKEWAISPIFSQKGFEKLNEGLKVVYSNSHNLAQSRDYILNEVEFSKKFITVLPQVDKISRSMNFNDDRVTDFGRDLTELQRRLKREKLNPNVLLGA